MNIASSPEKKVLCIGHELSSYVTLQSLEAEQVLEMGTVLGRVMFVEGATAADGSNTGNGTVTDFVLATGAKVGDYVLTCVAAAANGGTFKVVDPEGLRLDDAVVGAAFAGPVEFTVNDGATDFEVGDFFALTVDKGSEKFVPLDLTAVNGSQVASRILACDALVPISGDHTTNAYSHGEFYRLGLIWPEGINEAQEANALAQLVAAGIYVKSF